MARVFVAGYFGVGNFGDELLLSLMLAALEGTAEPIAVSMDPAHTRSSHGVEAVTADMLGSMLTPEDRLIVGPGGLFHNTFGPHSHQRHTGLVRVSGWVQSAADAGTPVAAFGVSIGLRHGKAAIQTTDRIVDAAGFVTTRDMEYTTESGRTPPVMPDLSFMLPPFDGQASGGPAIALRQWGSIDHVESSVRAVLGEHFDWLSLQPGDDGTPVVVDRSTDPRQLFSRSLLITMRYHAACMAIQTGTPTVLIDYGEPKMAGFAAATGTPIVPLGDVNPQSLEAAIDAAGATSVTSDRLENLRTTVNNNVDDLLAWITGQAQPVQIRWPMLQGPRLLGARGMLDRVRERIT